MIITLSLKEKELVVSRETGDPRMKSESQLLHHIKLWLKSQGHDVIKKLMWKDGHLTADTQHYIRSRNPNKPGAFCVYDGYYALRSIAEDYNHFDTVYLQVEVI